MAKISKMNNGENKILEMQNKIDLDDEIVIGMAYITVNKIITVSLINNKALLTKYFLNKIMTILDDSLPTLFENIQEMQTAAVPVFILMKNYDSELGAAEISFVLNEETTMIDLDMIKEHIEQLNDVVTFLNKTVPATIIDADEENDTSTTIAECAKQIYNDNTELLMVKNDFDF